MPSSHFQITAAEERKRRQEKFRKRTRSLFSKAKLLGKDTDAWVALIVRDRVGRVHTFRSSGSRHWPSSMHDLITANPSGTHEFVEKHAVSGCWKEVAEEQSDIAEEDCEAESVQGGVLVTDATCAEEIERDGIIPVDQCQGITDFDDHENLPRDTPNEIAANTSEIDPLGRFDMPLLGEPNAVSTIYCDAATDDGNMEVKISTVNSPKEIYDTFDSGLEIMQVGTLEPPSNESFDTAMESNISSVFQNGNPNNALDMSEEVLMAETDPITSGYDVIDSDEAREKNRVQSDANESKSAEAANTLYSMSQYHDPEGLGS